MKKNIDYGSKNSDNFSPEKIQKIFLSRLQEAAFKEVEVLNKTAAQSYGKELNLTIRQEIFTKISKIMDPMGKKGGSFIDKFKSLLKIPNLSSNFQEALETLDDHYSSVLSSPEESKKLIQEDVNPTHSTSEIKEQIKKLIPENEMGTELEAFDDTEGLKKYQEIYLKMAPLKNIEEVGINDIGTVEATIEDAKKVAEMIEDDLKVVTDKQLEYLGIASQFWKLIWNLVQNYKFSVETAINTNQEVDLNKFPHILNIGARYALRIAEETKKLGVSQKDLTIQACQAADSNAKIAYATSQKNISLEGSMGKVNSLYYSTKANYFLAEITQEVDLREILKSGEFCYKMLLQPEIRQQKELLSLRKDLFSMLIATTFALKDYYACIDYGEILEKIGLDDQKAWETIKSAKKELIKKTFEEEDWPKCTRLRLEYNNTYEDNDLKWLEPANKKAEKSYDKKMTFQSLISPSDEKH